MPSCSTTRDPRRDKGPRSVRGRQSANPRITGGLVSHEQAKRSLVRPGDLRDMATGSKRAAIRLAWSACWGPSGAWQPRTRAHPAAANIGRLPARQVVSGAKMQAPRPPCRSTSSTRVRSSPRTRPRTPTVPRPAGAYSSTSISLTVMHSEQSPQHGMRDVRSFIKGRLRSRCSCRPGARRRTSSLATVIGRIGRSD
jgi:hypothetical protein